MRVVVGFGEDGGGVDVAFTQDVAHVVEHFVGAAEVEVRVVGEGECFAEVGDAAAEFGAVVRAEAGVIGER